MIFEQFIGGQEIQVAIINHIPLGAIELIPKRTFYDYKAKYTKTAKTKHIMPARLNKNNYSKVLKIAKELTSLWDVGVSLELTLNFIKTIFIF